MSVQGCNARSLRRWRKRFPMLLAVLLSVSALMGPGVVAAQAQQPDDLDALLAEPATERSSPSAPPDKDPAPESAAQPEPAPAADAQAATPQALPTIPVATLAEPAATPAPSEKPVRSRTIEEILVTAQKREEAIQDVPISMSVIDEKFIAEQGITNVREAMLYVPNVKIEEAGYFMIPRIRGFSTNNNNKAFEPPAGLAIDGIPYGRIEYFNAGLYDISRVEVLRGPQGTTFGKNTSAGLIHLITKDPSDEVEGFINLQYGEYLRRRIEIASSVPVVKDFLNARVAFLKDERRGFVENTTAAISPLAERYLQGKDNEGMRLKLQFPDLAGSRLKLGYDKLELGSLGSGIEIVSVTDAVAEVLRKYDPNVDLVGGNQRTSLDYGDFRRTQIETVNGEWNYDLGGWGLTALGGRSVMDTLFFLDTDFSPSPAILGDGADRAPTVTAELRGASSVFDGLFGLKQLFGADLGSSDLLLGVFYQTNEIQDGYFHFAFPQGPFLELTAAAEGTGNGASQPPLVGGLFGVGPPASLGPNDAVDDVTQFFDQQSDTRAVFAQTQWTFLPKWTLQLGGRYSQEKKAGQWNSVFNSPPPNAIITAAGITEFMVQRSRNDKFFQPKVSLNYKPVDNISLFLRWARSFKSGGFNAFAFRAVEDQLVYQPEYSTEFAFDAKTNFLDNTMVLNLSVYRQEIKDFQVLTREPQPGTIGLGLTKVVNAPKARSQGIESDLRWLPLDWMQLIGSLGVNDTEYLDFKINDCPADMDNTDGDADTRCDATGRPFAFAPKINGAITTLFTPGWSLFGINFDAGLTGEYNSSQFLDIDLDRRKVQEPFWRFRASVGLGNPSQGWSFKLVGENLTDKVTYIRQGDVAPKQFVGITEPPRQVYGMLRWSF